jgi:hypothetical protein
MKSADYEATLAEASFSPIHRARLCSAAIHDTVGEFSGSCECGKRRGPGRRERNLIQPVNEAR